MTRLASPRLALGYALAAANTVAAYGRISLRQDSGSHDAASQAIAGADIQNTPLQISAGANFRRDSDPAEIAAAFLPWGSALFSLFPAAKPHDAEIEFEPAVDAVCAGGTQLQGTAPGVGEARALSAAILPSLFRWWPANAGDIPAVSLRVSVFGKRAGRADVFDDSDAARSMTVNGYAPDKIGSLRLPEINAWRAALGPWPGVSSFFLWFHSGRPSAHEKARVFRSSHEAQS